MSRIACISLSIGLLLAASSTLPAQGKFPLEPKEIKAGDLHTPFLSMAIEWVERADEKPAEFKKVPPKLPEDTGYFVAHVNGVAIAMLVLPTKPPSIHIDTDLDGDLTDEKPIVGKRMKASETMGWPAGYSFGIIPAPHSRPAAPDDAKDPPAASMQLNLMSDNYLMISPVAYRAGQIQVKDKKYRVRLIDGNYDGRYDGFVKFSGKTGEGRSNTSDCLAIDWNGDGQFEPGYDAKSEVLPLPRLLRFEDTWYGVQVAPDGSSISLEKSVPKFGTLNVGQPEVEMMLWSESGIHTLKGAEGKWQLPVGHYSCWSLTLTRKDEKKNKWTLRSRGNTGKLLDFEIAEGKTTSFKLGPPLTLTPTVRISRQLFRRTVTVSASAVGQSGEEYIAGVQKNNDMQPAPRIKIVDSSGKVVESGKLEYG
jgi:hypothetical protein